MPEAVRVYKIPANKCILTMKFFNVSANFDEHPQKYSAKLQEMQAGIANPFLRREDRVRVYRYLVGLLSDDGSC